MVHGHPVVTRSPSPRWLPLQRFLAMMSQAPKKENRDLDADILWFGAELLKDVPFGRELADSQMARP